jgi:hypothetical protein
MAIRVVILIALSSLTLATAGCPKQSSSTASAVAETAPVEKSRFSGVTKTFIDTLMANGIVGYDVAADGASVVYETVDLSTDGPYTAASTLRLGDEDPFSCTESGTWSLDNDEAVSATEAMATFNMESTDCPGRTAPKSWRAKLEISGSDVIISSF